MTEVERRRWLVEGRVQGVAYRWFARDAARALEDLRGYVRNLPDGRVEVVAQGSAASLAALESALKTGPPMARVEALVEATPPGEIATPGFEIRM